MRFYLAPLLSLLSIYLLICWYEKKVDVILMLATATAVFAGLTQIYAVIPFVIYYFYLL